MTHPRETNGELFSPEELRSLRTPNEEAEATKDAVRAALDGTLGVAETFYSIQGEGSTMGVPSVFLRLSGCNLLCGGQGTAQDKQLHDGAKWRCDTIETWMQRTKKEYDDILYGDDFIESLRMGAHLVVTGGEPTLQEHALADFLEYARREVPELYVELETNGTRAPGALATLVDQFNCSPKLANSGMPRERRFFPDVIRELNALNSIFKFVVSDDRDLESLNEYLPLVDHDKVFLMPAGETQELLAQSEQRVVALCKQFLFRYSGRLHINIWDKKTGV